MKSFLLKVLFLSATFFLFSACQEKGLAGDINQLEDNCSRTLKKAKAFEQPVFPIDSAKEYLSIMMPYFESFDKASLKVLVELANTEKASRKVNLDPSKLIEDLSFSQKQISALYQELKSDSLSREKSSEYFKKEQTIYYQLKLKSDGMYDSSNRLKSNFDRLLPKAKHLADSLRAL